jgi:hypothetical protein
MPYHAVAAGMPWAEVPGTLQVLILGLLKLAGSGWLTTAVAEFVLLLIPFRQGARWALWAVPSLGLLHYAGVFHAMAHVTLNTRAVPPWGVAISSVVLILGGASLSIPGRAQRGAAYQALAADARKASPTEAGRHAIDQARRDLARRRVLLANDLRTRVQPGTTQCLAAEIVV